MFLNEDHTCAGSENLEISPEILSPSTKGKHSTKQHHYKLFAVIYHNGTETSGGHYVTDVRSGGSWVRCDDAHLKPVGKMLQSPSAALTPYLLFYQRLDKIQMTSKPLNYQTGMPTITLLYTDCRGKKKLSYCNSLVCLLLIPITTQQKVTVMTMNFQ